MSYTKLYIIGNGFDLHHKIRSDFSDFKAFLKQENNGLFRLVEDYLLDIDRDEKEWGNFESALGNIDVAYIVENNSMFLPSYLAEDWSDSGHHDFQYEIDKIVTSLSATLRNQFANWVRRIEIPDATSAPNRLSTLNMDGLYLNFNYTSTLTSVYSVPATNILHIHGEAAMRDTDLVLGHAWNPSERKSLNDHPCIEDQDTRVTEAYNILDDYFGRTFKPSEKILQENGAFFARLRNIEEIFVLGHSLCDVDRSYFEAVVKAINVNTAQWTIACREQDDCLGKQALVATFGISSHLIKTVSWNAL